MQQIPLSGVWEGRRPSGNYLSVRVIGTLLSVAYMVASLYNVLISRLIHSPLLDADNWTDAPTNEAQIKTISVQCGLRGT
jgi:hypothetical protein